jgi:2-polyprenyl-3-methyl-5-hydroxy-6-metoxy-1,4-benzoquinol methylase
LFVQAQSFPKFVKIRLMSDISDVILNSWQANSSSWIETIDQEEIYSRKLATNEAIVNSILRHHPQRVLDLGCGEGWLCRTLHPFHVSVCGVDGAAALIENAKKKGEGPDYHCYAYQEIRAGSAAFSALGTFDLIAFNFALFEDTTATFALLDQLKSSLVNGGMLIIQTIGFSPDQPSAWQKEDWRTLKRDFPAPFPWYYRSLAEWKTSFEQHQWKLLQHDCILHPIDKTVLSWIFTVKN